MSTKIHLLIIDPQIDFCSPSGSLYVKGGEVNMQNLANLIDRIGPKLDNISVTLDQHHNFDISHPMYWKNSAGQHPAPFTMISVKDVENGTWTPSVPSLFKRSLEYVKTLEKKNRYVHLIWPSHCRIGSEGAAIDPTLFKALTNWEVTETAMVDFVSKGSNPYTEHFSGIMAEVPDPQDPTTQINKDLIETLEKSDICLIGGLASSHCVMTTTKDIYNNFSNSDYAKKLVILTDCMSPVPGFEQQEKDFFAEAKSKGVQFSTSVDFLK